MSNTTHDRWIMVSIFRTAKGFGSGYRLHVGYDSFRPYETLADSLKRIVYNIARHGDNINNMVKNAVVKTVNNGLVEREVMFD